MENYIIKNFNEAYRIVFENQELEKEYDDIMSNKRKAQDFPFWGVFLIYGIIIFIICTERFLGAPGGLEKILYLIEYIPLFFTLPLTYATESIVKAIAENKVRNNRGRIEEMSKKYSENIGWLELCSGIPASYWNGGAMNFFLQKINEGSYGSFYDLEKALKFDVEHRHMSNMRTMYKARNMKNYELFNVYFYNDAKKHITQLGNKKQMRVHLKRKKFRKNGDSIGRVDSKLKNAEYNAIDNPNVAMMILRSIAEDLVNKIYFCENIEHLNSETQVESISLLSQKGIISNQETESLHIIRKIGNRAVHESHDSKEDANKLLILTQSFYKSFIKNYTV